MENLIIFLNRIFDVLWLPLSWTPRYVDIALISAISALIFLVIYKKTSNQEMIRRYKNRMVGHILEIRLYKDQPVMTLKSILNILRDNMIYLRYALPPVIVLFLPLVIISIQINNRYGYSPLEIDQPFIIRVDLAGGLVSDAIRARETIRCETPRGFRLETPPMLLASEGSILWRARITKSGENGYSGKISINGQGGLVDKHIYAGTTMRRFSPKRTKWGLGNILVNNAEDFIPETSPFESVTVKYERATYPLLFWNTDPIIFYFVLTLIFGFLFKPLIKVTF